MTSDELVGMGQVGTVVYVTGCRLSKRIPVMELKEGDLFITDENPHEVLVVTEIGSDRSPNIDTWPAECLLYVYYLIVTGDEKGKTDVWPTNYETLVHLVEFVQAPVF